MGGGKESEWKESGNWKCETKVRERISKRKRKVRKRNKDTPVPGYQYIFHFRHIINDSENCLRWISSKAGES